MDEKNQIDDFAFFIKETLKYNFYNKVDDIWFG